MFAKSKDEKLPQTFDIRKELLKISAKEELIIEEEMADALITLVNKT